MATWIVIAIIVVIGVIVWLFNLRSGRIAEEARIEEVRLEAQKVEDDAKEAERLEKVASALKQRLKVEAADREEKERVAFETAAREAEILEQAAVALKKRIEDRKTFISNQVRWTKKRKRGH